MLQGNGENVQRNDVDEIVKTQLPMTGKSDESKEVKSENNADITDMKEDAKFSGCFKFYEFFGIGRQYLYEGLILPTIPDAILKELRKCSNNDHVNFLTILLLHFVRGPYGVLGEHRTKTKA